MKVSIINYYILNQPGLKPARVKVDKTRWIEKFRYRLTSLLVINALIIIKYEKLQKITITGTFEIKLEKTFHRF